MEGKEVRFGSALGGLFGAVTTGTSTGAINSWHDSFQPVAGLVPLFNIELGEITPGGIGAGMYGMLVIGAILAVFIAGLMVGRTPEYLGKKVEAFEIKMAMLVALVLGASILGFTAIASVLPGGHGRSAQSRSARVQRDPVRLLQPDGQQRLGLRRADRQHALLQRHRRLRDAHRPLRDDRADPRAGRFDGAQAQRRAVARHVPDDGRALGRPPHRRRHHRRRPDVLPGPRARPDRRAAPPERRKGLLMALLSVDLGRGTRRFQRFVTLGGAKPSGGEPPRPRGVLDPDLLRSAIPHAFRKLDPRLLIKNPVMFVVEITAVLVTLTAIADAARRAGGGLPAASSSRSRSGSGCGSRSCSRPTRRQSPRHAVAPRPRPCARPARRPPPTVAAPTARSRTSDPPSCARATSSSSRKARRSPATETSSRASASSTRPRSRANPRRSSRSRARTSAAR